jgi:XTP/dITP diphosphohydrolase
MEKLLSEMKGKTDRSARFRTVIAFIDDTGLLHLYEGIMNGNIAEKPLGTGGFGYDPVFTPSGYDCTYAEMTAVEKNRISHRAKAFQAFYEKIVP